MLFPPVTLQLTGNQTDKGAHTVGHCQLYIQRAQTTNQTGAHWGTVYMSTVHTEGTDNQPGWREAERREHRQPDNQGAHTDTVNCIYKGDRQPLGHCLLYIQRALTGNQPVGVRLDTEDTDIQTHTV